jgi:hypothetical protein
MFFDSTQVQSNEEPSDFGAIPEGKYLAQIAETEEKISGAGNKYLNIKLQVLEGNYKNRVLWDIVNLWHPKDNVRGIAEQTMKSICNAVKVLKPEHPEELHHKPLRVSISMETDSQYGDQNRVKKYLPTDLAQSSKQTVERILELPKRGMDAPVSTEATTDDIPF